MAQAALVISKDLINEMKRLAVSASKDDDSFEQARKRYEAAGEQLLSSSSELAVAMYNFTLRYAEQSDLIDAKLNELDIQFKSTSSVYVKIARLAFDDVRDANGEVSRTRVSRYAQVIENAHAQGYSADDFKNSLASGITQALNRIKGTTRSTKAHELEQGRDIASRFAQNQTVTIEHFPLPENASDGDDVELLARVEDGKLVVYGVVPSKFSNAKTVLKKLVQDEVQSQAVSTDLLPELTRTIKLATSAKDGDSPCVYAVTGDTLSFAVFGPQATAVLTVAADWDLFSVDQLQFGAESWRQILETLTPVRKHIQSVAVDEALMTLDFDENAVPDVNKWYEENKKPKRIGVGVGSTLAISLPLKAYEVSLPEHDDWSEPVSYTEAEFKALLDAKPSKKYTSFALAAGAIQPVQSAKVIAGHQNIQRKNMSLLNGAAKKFLRLANKVELDSCDGHLRISASISSGVKQAIIVKAD